MVFVEWEDEAGFGMICSGIAPDTITRKTLQFVYQQLPAWRDDPERPYEESENRLNLHLCKFLDAKARTLFPMIRFDHEEYQEGRRSIDISASPTTTTVIGAKSFTLYDPILLFEGKRLPPPSSSRENEYVTGLTSVSGGIQRYKVGVHGASHSICAIIGYLQRGSSTYWHDEINNWILALADGQICDHCVWNRSEILEDFVVDLALCVSRQRSSHSRTGNTLTNTIELYHLWIEMNPTASMP